VQQGPLIPGLEEFDRPRRGWPRWLTWVVLGVIAFALLVMLAGFVGGVGPLRALGQSTVPLTTVAFRETASTNVIEIAVTAPREGLCRGDEIVAVGYERGNRIEVEASITRSRSTSCQPMTMAGDLRWAPVRLDSPIGTRTVVSTDDRRALENRTAT
jgi:hypothetical protein